MTFMMSLSCILIDLASENVTLTRFSLSLSPLIMILRQDESWWVDIESMGDWWELKDTGRSGSCEVTVSGSLTWRPCKATATK